MNCKVILNAAIKLAHQSSWGTFTMQSLADELDCSLVDIQQYVRSKDDIAEVFFDLADEHMLNMTKQPAFESLEEDERLFICIMAWFDCLAPHKRLIREILAYKLEPGHLHLQAHGITRVSRTVQWFREASLRNDGDMGRSIDEVAVTGVFLRSFYFFLSDNSEQYSATRALLKNHIQKIRHANQFVARLQGYLST